MIEDMFCSHGDINKSVYMGCLARKSPLSILPLSGQTQWRILGGGGADGPRPPPPPRKKRRGGGKKEEKKKKKRKESPNPVWGGQM